MDWPGAIALPDGTQVRGRGRRQAPPPGPPPEHALHLGSARDRPDEQDRTVEWVDWPDFRTPRDPIAATAAVHRAFALARTGRRVEVTCGGGTGRTGTVIACLAVLAGEPGTTAVARTRRHYRRRAVETPGQRRWVRWFAQHQLGQTGV